MPLSQKARNALRTVMDRASANQMINEVDKVEDISSTEFDYFDGVTAGTPAASKALVLDASSLINGTISFGTIERGLDFGSATVGTTTDGVLGRAGTGIGASGLAFGTAGQRAFAFYLRPTATSGTFKGMRLRSIADPASGDTLNIDNLHVQTSVIASKDAAVINSLFVELIPKGTNVITYGRAMLVSCDSAASVTWTNYTVAHIRTHTRGDETMSGVDELLRLENEAVGGNGRSMDSYIRCMATNVNVSGADYLIDGGVDTTLLGTGVFRLPDDGTICSDSGTSGAGSHGGHILVTIGTTARYIRLHAVS